MNKKRAHICIDKSLWDEASAYARDVMKTDFTGFVNRLLVDELAKKKLLNAALNAAHASGQMMQQVNGHFDSAPHSSLNSSLDRIAAEQQTRHEQEAGRSRDAGGKGRANGRAAQAKTSRVRR